MKFTALIACSVALCQAAPQRDYGGGKRALYFLRADPQGASVVSIALNSQGQLVRNITITSTQGDGLQQLNYTTKQPVPADPLAGQQAVSIGKNYLFTVNSGSNTAVVFSINPQNPLELTMIGKPAATLGEFPMSIAYSTKYNKACVLNGGAVNGVACYSVSSTQGLVPDGVGLRKFGYSATTPPELGGPSGGGSDIQFSTDSTKVITTFKGTGKPATYGHVSIFNVDSNGDVAATFTDNQEAPMAAPFGFSLSGQNPNEFFIADVAFGGGNLVSLNPTTNKVTVVSTVNNTAFAASCWSVWSPVTNSYYNIDSASPNWGQINSAGNLTRTLTIPSALKGSFDSVVDGPVAYFLNTLNDVATLNLESGKVLHRFRWNTVENRQFWTGLAMYPSSAILTGGLGGY